MEKKIEALGEELVLAFNIATQICYEKITDKAFDLADLTKVENRMALYFSMIITHNPETGVTMDKLIREATFEDIKAIDTAANTAISEWYRIPKAANMDEGQEENEDQSKNV